jgi:DNA-binding XRE family transcriptional regulator
LILSYFACLTESYDKESSNAIITPLLDNHACGIYKKSEGVVLYTVSRYPAMSYGEGVRQKRVELGQAQRDLANLLGVSEMSVVEWEKGWHRLSLTYRRKVIPIETVTSLRTRNLRRSGIDQQGEI